MWMFNQIELTNGRRSKREIIVHGPAVAIIAKRDDGQFSLLDNK